MPIGDFSDVYAQKKSGKKWNGINIKVREKKVDTKKKGLTPSVSLKHCSQALELKPRSFGLNDAL